MAAGTPAIEFIGVAKRFPARGQSKEVLAATDVNFAIAPGEVVSIIGPSGCGKSTLLNMGSGLAKVSAGMVKVAGQVVEGPNAHVSFMLQKDLLMPWRTIAENIEFGLELRGTPRAERAAVSAKLLTQCHLTGFGANYPHQLSGGMRQRVLIAMAIACQPSLVIADEPTTALDVTIQAEILDLLRDMKAALGLSLLLITHDLGVIAETADRVAVMYAGRIVETGPVREIFRNAAHPYTRGLLASMPGGRPGQRLRAIEGSVPMLGDLPPGCAFNPRCPDRFAPCTTAPPPDYPAGPDQTAKCYLHAAR